MKTKLKLILTLFMAFVVHISFAQEKTITGKVTDESGIPLPGVTVLVKGTSNGVQTDFDGNYSITTNTGSIIAFSYVGYTTEEITVSDTTTINIVLTEDVAMLDTVVVTALGIKKEKSSLGYAVSEVKGEELSQQPEGDVGRLLRGKAAGVAVTSTNGTSGSATNMVIRGFTSISGSNQPLFIVDGVPFNSDTNSQNSYIDGSTESSRMLDLDPNNIVSVNVLKGLSASTLYGDRGRNGVILITTKNGSFGNSEKTTVDISSSVFFSTPHLPNYQDEFGGGFNQEFGWFFSNWGPAFTDTNPDVYGSYFNSVVDGQVYVNHPFATNVAQDYIIGYEDLAASPYAYKPYDSVENFFRTGVSTNQSVAVQGGTSNVKYSVNYSKLNDSGFTPGNELSRDNFGVGGRIKKGNLTVRGTLNYSKTDYKSPPIAASNGSGVIGDGTSIFGDIMYTPRNVDLLGIPYERADGGSLYYRETNGIQHPLWTVKNSKTGQLVNRIYGSFNVNYKLSEALSLNYKYGLDTYTENGFYSQNKGGIDGETTGILRTTSGTSNFLDHTLAATYNKDITDKLNLSVLIGANATRSTYERDGIESTNQIVFGVQKHYNYINNSSVNSYSGADIQYESERNTVGLYIDTTLGYENYLYLNLAARNDWTSTLEIDNNRIFYPSASVSFIPTAAFDNLVGNGDFGLNYLKLRLGYGTSSGFPPVYTTRNTLSLNAREFVTSEGDVISSNATSNFLGNPNLNPELVSELEFGIDSRFFNNRVGLNLSLFRKETTDLLTQRELDPSTGFTATYINGGSLEVKGLELDLNVDWFKNRDGFSWNTGVTFYSDETEITELPDGIDMIFLNSGLNAAIEGEAFGVIVGSQVERNDAGEAIVGSDGNYVVTSETDLIIGDPNPDYTSTITNTFSYKNLSLSVGLNYRKGGDIYSITAATLVNRGLVDFPLDRYGTYILPGVYADGTPNTTQINATDVAFDNWLYGANEYRVFDGTTIRLNEVSLSYRLPSNVLEKTPFSAISITASGSNLWYRAVNMPKDVNFDTNSSSAGVGNSLGIDYLTGPSAARYGCSVKLSF
ncbi:SusC/RagA family TonB-linked outer membrane protein [Winogradskyella endarachnes]|uniref:SusC/RagA family TonB-linked outer membrane protein n=1 Tax=Winogradskyella endarachnes TaxID=2681965 RepID=A0A6L6UC32_9FLAO|nr:SusC/RagA family TonB-linked outer membrane protein [Winogradskyella endarachnes]MUU79539.1 SusC/RagA family TonB-linked outer membrane protein [Winogradskyella endarachnes]